MGEHRITGLRATVAGASAAAVAATLAVGVTGANAAPSPAPATPSSSTPGAPVTLGEIQAKAAAAISKRIASLNAAVGRVQGTKALSSENASLVSYLSQDLTPLQDLGTKIAADTTIAAARADFKDIFVDYRVYALVLPAARQAAAADVITGWMLPRLTALSTRAQSHVTAANQATLQPMIGAVNADVSGATNALSGLSATVLGYTPSQWNADHSLLSGTRAKLKTAVSDVKNARSELRQVRRYLRANGSDRRRGGQVTPTTGA